jgi:DNA-binding Lrp family transcriptional regulator
MKKPLLRPDFLITPYQLYNDPDMQPLDRDVYGVIYWFEHLRDGECRASNETIGEVVHAKPRSVQNSLNRLEKAGYIKREYKGADRRNRLRIKALLSYRTERNSEDTKPASELVSTRERTGEDTTSELVSTRDSKSKKVRKESTLTPPQADGVGKVINEVMGLFLPVNTSIGRLFGRDSQRNALERLIKQHGRQKIEDVIKFLPKSNSIKYAPTITTPIQLEDKLGSLIAWSQKQKSRVTSDTKQFIL